MPPTTCCIKDCLKTKHTTKLYSFPLNEVLRRKWVTQIAKSTPEILNIRFQALINQRVCINHFDWKNLNRNKRLPNSIPSIFPCRSQQQRESNAENKENKSEIILSSVMEDGSLPPEVIYSNVEKNILFGEHEHIQAVLHDHRYAKEFKINLSYRNPIPKMESENIQSQSEESNTEGFIMESNMVQSDSNIYEKTDAVGINRIVETNKILEMSPKIIQISMCSDLYTIFREIMNDIIVSDSPVKNNIAKAELFLNSTDFKNFNRLKNNQKECIILQLKKDNNKNVVKRHYTLKEKLLSLELYKKQPKSYELLHEIYSLPCKSSLYSLLNFITVEPGINNDIFKGLKEKVDKWKLSMKMCCIVFDEIELIPNCFDVPIDKKTNKKKRFCLVFMVRGIVYNWKQPIAYYLYKEMISHENFVCMLTEVVEEVIRSGLEPLAFVCDPSFHTILNTIQKQTNEFQLKRKLNCDNTIMIQNRNLNIIYDPPSLLKEIRNCMLKSNIIFKENLAKWDDIVEIYNVDRSTGVGSSVVPKLTDEHVFPNKINKSKVSFCSEVFSDRVAAVLLYTSAFALKYDGTLVSNTVSNTGNLVTFFDKLFDTCNGSQSGKCHGKLRGPVKMDTAHKKIWEDSIKIFETIKFVNIFDHSMTYPPCLANWITTLNSLLNINNKILKSNVKFFYTRHLNKDPLENFFAQLRNYQKIKKPYINTFKKHLKLQIVNNYVTEHSKFSNCEDDNAFTVLNLEHLLGDLVDPK